MLLIFWLLGCNSNSGLEGQHKDILSITCTTYIQPDKEAMLSTIYQYVPATGEVTEIYNYPYTAQYPLGVFSPKEKVVYYTKKDETNRDQIFSYHMETKQEVQLTTNLRAVNQIIPAKEKIFFIASIDKVLRLGMLDKRSGMISYWGDEDTNVETIAINPKTEHIYISAFSYSQDREVIENQFLSDENNYSMPLFSVYETDYSFKDTQKFLSVHAWIKILMVNMAENVTIAIYDKEYNSEENSKAVAIDVSSQEIEEFKLPPERMLVDGANYSANGKGLYVTSIVNDKRGIYYYDFESKEYNTIFISADGFINNFQFISSTQ
ncbi:hypothetical protein QW71_33720 [Paenibacillus sp. IHB B 3415]|uniref:hypothetical protein n=1 Tax=Paenibacillus sp. IHB B 3415 TaxID=867080 RepID=UPI00057357C4|nr:hypothetical protein [Paenibacillus sp. IHB B 3415]KHL91581.1 hypothetical protein QW71_33720 [Paenibacillus sp. IHB B 3415]